MIQPLVGDAILNGMAALCVGLAGYLFWLRFRENHEQRKLQRERERDRRKHWGYV